MIPLLLSLLAACSTPEPATAEELAHAERIAQGWFDAVAAGDCPELLERSHTQMTLVQCRVEIDVLRRRSPTVLGIESVRPHPTRPGAVEVEARVIDLDGSETVVGLTVDRIAGKWLVVL